MPANNLWIAGMARSYNEYESELAPWRNLSFRDGGLDTAMRSIWGGQACCSVLPHQRATPHRVARAPQGAPQLTTRHTAAGRRGLSDNGVVVETNLQVMS
jgi:hypothetical protein